MKIIAIIPARYGSKRLPGKPLIQINKKALIQITYESVLGSNLFDLIFVATDSEKIKKTVINFGGQCVMTSSKHLNGTERCAELINKLKHQISNQDLIVNIQCDEPFIKKNHLKKVINLFKVSHQNNIGTLVSSIEKNEIENPSIVKLNVKNNAVVDFSRQKAHFNKKTKIYKHIGVYGYRAHTLLKISKLKIDKREAEESLEQLRWIAHDYEISYALINQNLTSINTEIDIKKL